MSRLPLHGFFAPLVTPFGADGEPDEAGWRHNARAALAAGLDGLVIAGSTGEAALLDETERHRLVEWSRPFVPSDRWLIVGCGAESTRLTLRRCREAAARGADAVLVVAPHYYGAAAMTDAALRAHYESVADESPVPVILYNIPKYMHFALSPELVATLADHPNVIGIKDSSGDQALRTAYVTAQDDDFSVITGHAGSLARALDEGVRGGILAVADFAPALVRRLAASHAAGDRAVVDATQAVLAALGSEIVAGMGVPGVKAAMDAVGLFGGPPRSPLLPLPAEDRQRVATLLADGGVESIEALAAGA